VTARKPSQQAVDYERIAKAIDFIGENMAAQPSLGEIAQYLHLSPFHCQKLFSRWAGLTPKQFLQVLTLEHAKQQLSQRVSLLDAATTAGLSGTSRLHDHFVTIEAMTPGEFKLQGEGLKISYGHVETPFGRAFFAATKRGICMFGFTDKGDAPTELTALKAQFPHATMAKDNGRNTQSILALFNNKQLENTTIPLHISGTNFQIQVWKALLRIPEGATSSYSEIANAIGKPKAARAVGTAIGSNPIAFLIPCHRVLRQSGALGGYRWGLTRKRALLAWEVARLS
jgi:AraC family transcriptional regulator, regulatory protein of adaptative response / methylated-DNA-[protein]-cysteine methyltransferase